MSETTKRTSEQIGQEFSNLAYKAGNTQYNIHEQTKELAMINETLRSLGLEYNKVAGEERAAAAQKAVEDAKAAAVAPEPTNV